MEGAGNRHLPADVLPLFQEGIGFVLSRWSALQLAVENEWGGRESCRKSELLCSDIFAWFTQSKETLYVDDLESILDEAMLSLNTMAEDGSVEEVAEKLIIMYEECLDGDFRSIESLRQSDPPRVAHVSQVVNDDDDDDDDDEEEEDDVRNGKDAMRNDGSSDMMVDAIEYQSNSTSQPMPVNQPNTKASAEAEDGWVQVSSRRNRAPQVHVGVVPVGYVGEWEKNKRGGWVGAHSQNARILCHEVYGDVVEASFPLNQPRINFLNGHAEYLNKGGTSSIQ